MGIAAEVPQLYVEQASPIILPRARVFVRFEDQELSAVTFDPKATAAVLYLKAKQYAHEDEEQ